MNLNIHHFFSLFAVILQFFTITTFAKTKSDSNQLTALYKSEYYLDLGKKHYYNLDLAYTYFDSAQLSSGNDDSLNQIILFNKAVVKTQKKQHEEAYILFKEAYKLPLKNKRLAPRILRGLGITAGFISKYAESLRYSKEAKKRFLSQHDSLYYFLSQIDISRTYFDTYNYRETLEYLPEELFIFMDKNGQYKESFNAYILKAEANVALFDTNQAIHDFRSAVNYAHKTHDSTCLGISFHCIGKYYSEINRLDSSLYFFKKAQVFLESEHNTFSEGERMIEYGYSLLKLDQKKEGIEIIKKGIRKSLDKKALTPAVSAYLMLSKYHEDEQDWKKAYFNYKKANEIKSEIKKEAYKIEQIHALERQYQKEIRKIENAYLLQDSENKEMEIKLQSYINISLILLLVLLIAFVIIVQKSRKKINNFALKLKTKNAALQHQNNLNKQVISIISHDLRSPIVALQSMINILKEERENKQVWEMTEVLSGRSIQLLDNLVEWSKLQYGKNQLPLYPSSIKEALDEAQSQLSYLTNSKNIQIDTLFFHERLVIGNKLALETIFRNLISNAVKFSEPGEKVAITCEKIEETILISVSDNGVGMEQSKIDQLCQNMPLESLRGTDNEKGSGLGLNLVSNLLLMQNSKLHIRSTLGKGSTFSFSLKIATT